MRPTIFLDAGHGGLSSGLYTTPTKVGKRSTHTFPFSERVASPRASSEFLEGVKNRTYIDALAYILTKNNFNVVKVYDQVEDTSLSSRVAIANTYHRTVSRGIYLSEHSNAFNGTARGYSIFTSRGSTQSDYLAQSIAEEWRATFPSLPFRSDLSDRDLDFEQDFFVLRNTFMPAVLIENLFFDNAEDAKLLDDTSYLTSYTEALFRGINKWL